VVLRTRKKKTELWWCCGAGSHRCRCRRGGCAELLERSCGGDGTVPRWLRGLNGAAGSASVNEDGGVVAAAVADALAGRRTRGGGVVVLQWWREAAAMVVRD